MCLSSYPYVALMRACCSHISRHSLDTCVFASSVARLTGFALTFPDDRALGVMLHPTDKFCNKNCLVVDYRGIKVAFLAASTHRNLSFGLHQHTPRASPAATSA